MGYLNDVSKQIKNGQDIIFVGTGIIVINKIDKILMARRVDNNQWSLPGGSLEIGESLEECIIRETYEETGIRIDIEDIHLNSAKALPQPVNKNGVPIHVVSVVYWVNKYCDTDFKLDSREFTEYGWFTLKEIAMLGKLTPYSKIALEEYCKRHIGRQELKSKVKKNTSKVSNLSY